MLNFKKNIIIFTFISLVLSSISNAEVVKKIEIKGNERITLETIVVFGDINLGSDYKSSDLNLLIKKLYDTNFFSNISAQIENEKLIITVTENPIINSIIFNGENAKKFTEKLSEILTLREKSSFVKSYVNPDISIIKEFYRQLGFYFVEITADIEALDKNRINLIYTLDKGKKAKISKIYFLGDKKVRESKLREVITSQESRFWKFVSKNVYLNKDRIELDKRLLKSYYRNIGYYEVDVGFSSVEFSENNKDDGFIVTYTINAGKRYRFKKISAEVAKELDQTAFNSLESEFTKVIGEYYSQKKLTKILEKIDKLSEQKELQFINHSVSETLEGNSVDIKINIYEGDKFLVERINIAGNTVTNDDVIRSEMLVDEGDPFSEILINKSVNRLKSLGIFGGVESSIKEGSSDKLKVLDISVTEKPTGEISAGAGVGTDGTSFLFSVAENNWLGRGVQVNTSLYLTTEKITGSLNIRNPNYNYSGNAVFGGFNISSTDATVSSGYKSSKTGFNFGTEFEQLEGVYLSPSLSIVFEDIEAESTATAAVKKQEGSFSNIDFTYGVTIDKRNQSFEPTSGYVSKFTQSLPLLFDKSSILNSFNATTYHGFSENVIGATRFLGQMITGVKGEDVRLTNRLFIPQNRLRGFNVRKVGPKDGIDWIGGNYITAVGFEAKLPNLLPEATKTDLSVFIDVANVWGVDFNSSIKDTNQLRSAVGVAANVFTILGPLSFTLAQDLAKASTDETQTFNFRIGTSF